MKSKNMGCWKKRESLLMKLGKTHRKISLRSEILCKPKITFIAIMTELWKNSDLTTTFQRNIEDHRERCQLWLNNFYKIVHYLN